MTTATWRSKLKNLLSRKFLDSLTGIITGIITITQGQVVTGASLVAVSIVSYLIAEGYVDAKAVSETAKDISSVINVAAAATDNKALDDAAEIANKDEDQLDDTPKSTT